MSMKNMPLSAAISSLALLILGILLSDPFDITMNNMVLIVISGLLLASFGLFAGLFWQEHAADEREAVLLDKAGRLGYLAGLTVLVIGVVIQSFNHNVDIWLVLTIAAMIIAKHIYLGSNK